MQEKTEYNPELHAGLLSFKGSDYVIADAKVAKLHLANLQIRESLALATITEINLLSMAQDGVIVELTDPGQTELDVNGYRRGLDLLGFSADELKRLAENGRSTEVL